jgi:hypothetical protein
MTKTIARISLAATVTLCASVSFAQDVPTLDVATLCKAEAKQAGTFAENCMNDQKKARQDLVSQWSQFTPASRKDCIQLVRGIRGLESYVELLTCLQMRQEVRELPKQ